VSYPSAQEVVTGLAELAGVPAPDLKRQGPVGIATARVHLTNLATEAGATWRQIADVYGHRNPQRAKHDHHQLERELRAQLVQRQNAN
jgi:hypothetical protein